MKESNRKGIKLVSTIHRDLLKNITMKKRMTPTTGHSFFFIYNTKSSNNCSLS